jgi:hypothetical protein
MTSLYNRASPSQARILRIIEGAVKNAAYAHPEYDVPKRFARSIAKRATGTLTAQWPEVLAAKNREPSDKALGEIRRSLAPPSAQVVKRQGRGASKFGRRSPLAALRRDVGIMASIARRAGQHERLEALADVLRLLAKL